MKLYKKKIEEYKRLIQGQYVRDISVQNTVHKCVRNSKIDDALRPHRRRVPNTLEERKDGVLPLVLCSALNSKIDDALRSLCRRISNALCVRADVCRMHEKSNVRTSYFEFLYEQSKFIKKRWWVLQGAVLLILWFLLRSSGSTEYMGRITGILASVFVVLLIPEIWKNRRCSAIEIEMASFYSLRQICAARILLFAIVDLMMLMVFFMLTFSTIQISVYNMAINFMVPFNVSGCICFRLLYSKWIDSEYIAVFVSMVWIIVWSAVVTNNSLYHIVAEPIWLGLVLLSFGYLVFLIQKSQLVCENVWRDDADGINI